jgi:lysylphosphatidylglycerol synthetase-like protein (DUF2156 family)
MKAREGSMAKINATRVLMGGLVAGAILNVLGYGAYALFLERKWSAAMAALGRTMQMSLGDILVMLVFYFVVGILAVWLYALIRPRCGPGPKTALFAGCGFWVLTGALPTVSWGFMRLFPVGLLVLDVLTYLVMLIVATLVGAWLYKEETA